MTLERTYRLEGSAASILSASIPIYLLAELRLLEPPSYLIHKVVPENGLVYLVAEPSSKKTFVAVHMACCIQTGTPFFEKPVKQGNVVYIAAEGQSGIQKRVAAWQKATGKLVSTEQFSVIPSAINLADRIKQIELFNALTTLEKSLGSLDFIVIDTLSRCLLGDENSAKEITAFVDACSQLIKRFKCSVLVVHHTAKSGSGGARGHSSFDGAADLGLAIKYGKKDRFVLKLDAKPPKDDEPALDLHLKANSTDLSDELGFDAEGQAITSLALELSETKISIEQNAIKPKSKAQVLNELIADFLHQRPMSRGAIKKELKISDTEFSDKTLTRALNAMLEGGVISKKKRGVYELIQSEMDI